MEEEEDKSFDVRLLDWRQLESEATDAEEDLHRIGNGVHDPRLRELQLLADQLRAEANAALRRLLHSLEGASGRH